LIDSAVILAISPPTQESKLSQQRPRAMLPALGKPMVVRVMEQLYRSGIRHYILVLGMHEGAVASYLNKQWMPDATIEFLLRGDNETLGMVFARVAKQLAVPYMVASYDTFTYERFVQTLLKNHDEHPEHTIITGARQTLSPHAHHYYAIMDGQRIQTMVHELPADDTAYYVLTDHIVFGTHLLDHLMSATHKEGVTAGRRLTDVITRYADMDASQLRVVETSWILRVEQDKDLLTLNKRLLEDSTDAHVLSELPYTVRVIPPVRIDPQVSVGQGVVIGPHVYVERGSSIGYGATVRNALILAGSSVAANSIIDGCIITSKGAINLD